MTKNFKQYYKEGHSASKGLFKRKGNFIRFYLIGFMNLIAILFPIIIPVLRCGRYQVARDAHDGKDISISRMGKAMDNGKNYWTYLLSGALKIAIVIGAIIMIGAIGGVLFGLGTSFEIVYRGSGSLPILLSLPAWIALVVLFIMLPIITVPIGYIVNSTNGINSTKVVHESFYALRRQGKLQLFQSYLFEGLILAGGILAPIFVSMIPYLASYSALPYSIILGLLLLLPALRFVARMVMTFDIYRHCLFEDIVVDKFEASKRISGVNLDEVVLDYNKPAEERLTSLFDGIKKRKEVKNEIEGLRNAVANKTVLANSHDNDEYKPSNNNNNIDSSLTDELMPDMNDGIGMMDEAEVDNLADSLDDALADELDLANDEAIDDDNDELSEITGELGDFDVDNEPINLESDENPIDELEDLNNDELENESDDMDEPLSDLNPLDDLDEPVADFVAEEEPIEEPTSEDESIEEPAFEEESIEEPVAEEEPIEEPVAEDEAIEEPVAEDEAIEEPVAEEESIEEPVVEDEAIEEPVAEDEPIEEPVVEAKVAEAPKPKPVTVKPLKPRKKIEKEEN